MVTKDETDEIIRAYFTARETDGKDYAENHKTVVNILRQYPEYAIFFLTHEEQTEE